MKNHSPHMYQFWSILHGRKSEPSAEQIQVAEGKKVFADSSELLRYLDSISSSVERQHTLWEALTRAAENKLVSLSMIYNMYILRTYY